MKRNVSLRYVLVWSLNFCLIRINEPDHFVSLSVYTDQGKVRALIRSALNERAMERYVLTWLGDLQGLSTHFETWALIRDIEAINLLPSIAAGTSSSREVYSIKIKSLSTFVQDLVQYCSQ